MSVQFFGEDILFLQRFLQGAGFYTSKLDGIYGEKTDAALNAFEERTQEISDTFGQFDARSERNIASLNPKAQEVARKFLKKVRDAGIDARIISGTRTYVEQDALFRKGRFGNPPPIVTKAKGGRSNHNFGIAWDIGIFNGGAYLEESPLYDKAAEVGLAPELEWGGHWESFKDKPHYQLATGLVIASVRDRFEVGQAIV
ncbi:M15 family metallopeptidase [Nitrosomonas sp. Nm166]|uniref:M15 family metallopeptidase n=1 Tax=Nitrosomonas sp. Nm166 TaxID=1881054 RepID=UPI0008F1577C|nr:M15 family metallopeptidase [Nitrosomonas sp. Nm166]SFE85835.1 peptidoglycan L-alanyl-D-glutamate endopeptidase CwlK [Nitrosomonas sp. Nm166]